MAVWEINKVGKELTLTRDRVRQQYGANDIQERTGYVYLRIDKKEHKVYPTDEIILNGVPFSGTNHELFLALQSYVAVTDATGTGPTGPQGIPGPKGDKGDKGDTGDASTQLLTVLAGETISGGKVVTIATDGKAYVYDISDESNYGKVCGIAKTSASTGASLEIYTTGEAYEAGAGWQSGSVYYVSATGQLTTTPPSQGIVKVIGVGVATDKIVITHSSEYITI